MRNSKDEPLLWLVECFNPSNEAENPLELSIHLRQIQDAELGLVLDCET